jgi:hypothetical protein
MVKDFVPSLFSILPHKINCLALKVQGKKDPHPITMLLYADDQYPDLCPVRALMVYCFLIGIKNGYLFPSAEELVSKPLDGIYKTKIPYDTFNDALKAVCSILLRIDDLKIGSHVCRKTGYCLAVFGKADRGDLMNSARHKSVDVANTYLKDAAASLAIHERTPHPSNFVSEWRKTRVDGSGSNAAVMSALGGSLTLAFHELGPMFVRKHLQIQSGHQLEKDPIFLMEEAQSYTKRAGVTATEKLKTIAKDLHPDKAAELLETFNLAVSENVQAALVDPDLARATVGIPCSGAAVGLHDTLERPSKKARVDVASLLPPAIDPNIPERLSLRQLQTAREKVDCMLKIAKDRKQLAGKATTAAKDFCKKYVNPVLNCIERHFQGNVDEFCVTYKLFDHTTFPVKHCCGGKGSMCEPKPEKK